MFIEASVSMLSAVPRSKTAVAASVNIMDAFVEMRHFIAGNAAMLEQIRAVNLRQLEYQKSTDERLERVFDYMETHDSLRQKVFSRVRSGTPSSCWSRSCGGQRARLC